VTFLLADIFSTASASSSSHKNSGAKSALLIYPMPYQSSAAAKICVEPAIRNSSCSISNFRQRNDSSSSNLAQKGLPRNSCEFSHDSPSSNNSVMAPREFLSYGHAASAIDVSTSSVGPGSNHIRDHTIGYQCSNSSNQLPPNSSQNSIIPRALSSSVNAQSPPLPPTDRPVRNSSLKQSGSVCQKPRAPPPPPPNLASSTSSGGSPISSRSACQVNATSRNGNGRVSNYWPEEAEHFSADRPQPASRGPVPVERESCKGIYM